jgi:hypothetical protein
MLYFLVKSFKLCRNKNNNNISWRCKSSGLLKHGQLLNISDVSKEVPPSSLRSKSARSILDYLTVKIKALCSIAKSIGRSVSDDGKLHQHLFQKTDFELSIIIHTKHKGPLFKRSSHTTRPKLYKILIKMILYFKKSLSDTINLLSKMITSGL